MTLAPGTRLGPYEVTAQIGAGGMGEVYRATDTHLKRAVAIKVLPTSVAGDVERLARFQREAEVLATLNHPNIAQIHGLEQSNGTLALVMELVEGPTLADRIAQGAVPVDEALAIARQIAEALEAAHEQGIIHRDVKPANIKVRPDGTVKVLDFGLAKAMEPTGALAAGVSQAATITTPALMTGVGVILGTAAYMSPEQAKGRMVDKRSDVWAFGAVLYEMFTGRRAFEGDGVSDTLARILMKEPDWTALPATVPAAVVTVMQRCLQKDRKQRVRDIGDVSLALEGAFETSARTNAAGDAPVSAGRRRTAVPWVAAIVACSSVTAAAVWIMTRSVGRPSEPVRFAMTLPDGDRLPGSVGTLVAVSPDGRTLLYRAQRDAVFRLYARPIGQFEATAIGDTGAGESPAFSPDGQWVAFQVGSVIKKVPVAGGPSQTVGEASGGARGISWGADDTIVLGLGTAGLGMLPAAGGTVTTLATPSDNRLYWYPQVLPGGRAVLYTASEPRPDAGEIQVLTLGTGERRTLLPGAAGRYLPSGHLVFVRGASLWAVAFDPERLEVRGTPALVVEGVRVEPGGAVQASVGDDGTLAYLPGGAAVGLSLAWVDRAGREEPIDAPPRQFRYPRVSPDGTRVAVQDVGDESDIWVWQLARETLTRLTFGPAVEGYPAWTPDGRRILFSSSRDKVSVPFWQLADGTGATERLVTGTTPLDQSVVSPDGRWLVSRALQATTGEDIVAVDLVDQARLQTAGSGGVRPLVQTKFNESIPVLSPDGRWLAYQSDESGAVEIYVRPFPDVDAGRWQVSAGGGTYPMWGRDGRELFYLTPDDWLMTVPIQREESFTFGSPTRVVELARYYTQVTGRNYDVSADGRRFLVLRGEEEGRADVRVVLDWREELNRLVPTN